MKLIFLDFDGVLNSKKWFNTLNNRHVDDKIILVDTDQMLDPEPVELINQLVEQTGAEVIISSSWRILHTLDSLNQSLKDAGARFKATDVTQRLYTPRGIEIQTYLDYVAGLGGVVEQFVIIDDDSDMEHLRNTKHFIKTIFVYGFTKWHFDEALKVLNGD